MKLEVGSCAVLAPLLAGLLHGDPLPPEGTVQHADNSRFTIERVARIDIPEPPAPAEVTASREPSPALAAFIANRRDFLERNPLIHAAAIIHRLPDGRTLTEVTRWQVNQSPSIRFWTNADLSLLARSPAIAGSDPSNATLRYRLSLLPIEHDHALRAASLAKRGLKASTPRIPEIPTGPAVLHFDPASPAPDPAALAAARAILAHHDDHLATLTAAALERRAAQALARLQPATPAPEPRDFHLQISRLTPAEAAAWHHHHLTRDTPAKSAGEEGPRSVRFHFVALDPERSQPFCPSSFRRLPQSPDWT